RGGGGWRSFRRGRRRGRGFASRRGRGRLGLRGAGLLFFRFFRFFRCRRGGVPGGRGGLLGGRFGGGVGLFLGHVDYPSMLSPMLRAVPATMRAACSSSRAFRSLNFRLAISFTWAAVTLKPLYLPVALVFSSGSMISPPFFFSMGMPAACLSRTSACGLLTSYVSE